MERLNLLEKRLDKLEYVLQESKKIVPAVLFHINKLIEREEAYKLKHKKTLNHLKEVKHKLSYIESEINYQVKLYNKFKEEGMIKDAICVEDEA